MSNQRKIKGMLTIGEVTQLLNVHINTVRRWSNQGILKSYRIGHRGDRRFREEDITNFLSAGNYNTEISKEKVTLDLSSDANIETQ